MASERIVIVGYKPHKGKEDQLMDLVKVHNERLRKLNLVSGMKPVIGMAEDGSIIEIFSWRSKEAIEEAHHNPEVQQLWKDFNEVCDYIPAGKVSEMQQLFSEFTYVNPV